MPDKNTTEKYENNNLPSILKIPRITLMFQYINGIPRILDITEVTFEKNFKIAEGEIIVTEESINHNINIEIGQNANLNELLDK